ncbi:Serine/threonine-protein kinase STY17 [Hypsizygus marmoreus]|uniref:Serine/threonine-protein kinase STY17 n=1 Tax=Hypsizygus marmoreus TaxID=39966 RepID=A0A369JP49_HYPMA|nr:Serine/threonine-protein kinase STY17 [Hypsizygus marmoreus]
MASADLSLLAQFGPPGLGAGVALLTTTYMTIENIKVYKQQCTDMSARCVSLMVSLRDSSAGLEGSKAVELADEITAIVRRIDRKVTEWAALSRLKSFLQQREIKDGIDRLHRDMDAAIMKFNMSINMELTRGHQETRAIQERDKAEMREVLQDIVQSTQDMKALLSMQSSQPVEEIMESLQNELRSPGLQPLQWQTFREGLWLLHEKTSKLPPLTDLTGQVTLTRNHAVAKGTFNDVFIGEWLDEQRVALRLPRTLTNNTDVQKRFQREVAIWRSLDHPNVVPLYGIVYIGEDVYSVSPWMENGTAIQYVQTHPTADRLQILSEAASGLEYLHLNGIVHGDLRGANILISSDGVAGLSDFGLSKFLEDCGQGMTASPSVNPRWFAPELLRQTDPLSTHSDVWSFAMVCLELMTGEQPFSRISRDIIVLRELDQGKLPERPGRQITAQGLSDDLWVLMKKCWHKRPESRPSMTYVKEKLAELRGISSPTVNSPPTKRRSMFSLRRPSTAPSSSDHSSKSPQPVHRLKMPPLTPMGGQIQEEADELSPVSSSNSSGARRHPSMSHSDPYHGAPSKLIIPIASEFSFGASPRDKSITDSDTSRLEVPWTSASLPSNFGPHMPQRTVSSEGYPQGSVISSDSGIQLPGSVKEAVTNPKSIIHFNRSGSVSSGTLEGLVERLISNFNVQKDLEYRDILFTGCTDFTTPDDLFGILARRFHEVEESSMKNTEDKVAIQYNIFMVISYWLTSRHLFVDPQLLWQMRNFCIAAGSMKSSTTMNDRARDLMRLIDDRTQVDGQAPSLSLAPGRRIPRTSEMLPHDLAIALTLLEGDKYKAILPTDYIAHLRKQVRPNNVEAAYLANNKIVLWVKQSVLHYDAIDSRAQVLKFFVNTAMECRKLRNFASVTAVANALHSAPIERLRLTRRELSPPLRQALDELDDLLDPSSNHRTYRAALRECASQNCRDACVPWIAVHLRELHSTLQKYPVTVEVDGVPLINFERYVKFTDRIKEVLHYEPPDLERYRQQGQLAYLEHQLRGVHLKPTIDEDLMERSLALEAGEARDYRTRKRELKRLGFKTS